MLTADEVVGAAGDFLALQVGVARQIAKRIWSSPNAATIIGIVEATLRLLAAMVTGADHANGESRMSKIQRRG